MEERVRRNTSDKKNSKIDQKTIGRISQLANAGTPAIFQRIEELDAEWDIERVLEVNMPIVALTGLALAITFSPWWLIFPAIVLLFFLQHAIQGWCPPLPVFRSLGYRTKAEIHREKYALKLLRGDFESVRGPAGNTDTQRVWEAVSR